MATDIQLQKDGETVTNQEKWEALIHNCADFDGKFFYAVKSTGIYCRPSCNSKTPLQENVVFFETSRAAVAAGYRPCKRCRPDLPVYEPIGELASEVKRLIDQLYLEKQLLSEKIGQLGVSERRVIQIFKEKYGITPAEYSGTLKIKAAEGKLKDTNQPILDIALSLDFESLPAFFAFFRKKTGKTPGEYRNDFRRREQVEHLFYGIYETSIGVVTVAASKSSIVSLRMGKHIPSNLAEEKTALTDQAISELNEYLDGKRTSFQVPIEPQGTAFQKKVWEALQQIAYGETRTYKQIAETIGNPGASRAVGMANNKNPIWIIIPCHRVIGSNGSLVGYAGGIHIKERLLNLEKAHS